MLLSYRSSHCVFALQFHRRCIDEWLRSGHSVCPVDGISVHTRGPQTRRRQSSKREQLRTAQSSKESLPQDFSLVGHSALNMTPSITGGNHYTRGGRIQRGGTATQHGCHPKLPVILPQLVIGSMTECHAQHITHHHHHHHHKAAKKLSAHKPLPSVGSPDPNINITGVPIVSGIRVRTLWMITHYSRKLSFRLYVHYITLIFYEAKWVVDGGHTQAHTQRVNVVLLKQFIAMHSPLVLDWPTALPSSAHQLAQHPGTLAHD